MFGNQKVTAADCRAKAVELDCENPARWFKLGCCMGVANSSTTAMKQKKSKQNDGDDDDDDENENEVDDAPRKSKRRRSMMSSHLFPMWPKMWVRTDATCILV
jgi:hypothetical protein